MSYINEPCERCGSKKRVTKSWKEDVPTSLGTSVIEVSQVTCSNAECQKKFEADRAEEMVKINERKSKKAIQDDIRKKNIAQAILERQKNRINVKTGKSSLSN